MLILYSLSLSLSIILSEGTTSLSNNLLTIKILPITKIIIININNITFFLFTFLLLFSYIPHISTDRFFTTAILFKRKTI